MNSEELFNKVVESIEAEGGKRFNMNTWIASDLECGTVCCIAGHAAMLMEGVPPNISLGRVDALFSKIENLDYQREIFEAMGLEFKEFEGGDNVDALFAGSDEPNGESFADLEVFFSSVTPAQAVQALKNTRDTGWPKWRSVMEDV